MEQRRNGMEPGDPKDNVPQCGVQVSQRKPEAMRRREHRADVPETPKRERMPFHPRADNSGNRSRDQETIEHQWTSLAEYLIHVSSVGRPKSGPR